jgi:hypothetical protein
MPVCTELLPKTRFFNTRTDTAGRGLAMASNLIGFPRVEGCRCSLS